MGPLLFLFYINDIHCATELATFLFADDTSCLAEHNNLQTLITYVNAELQKLATLFKVNKMAVNVSKTNYIIFRTVVKKIDADLPDVVFNSNDLNSASPDPSLIQKLEQIHDNNDVPKLTVSAKKLAHSSKIIQFFKSQPMRAPDDFRSVFKLCS